MVWDRNLDEDERSDRIKCRNNNMSEKWKVKSNTKPEFISSERELVEQNREVKVSSGVCFIHSSSTAPYVRVGYSFHTLLNY